MTAWPTGEPSLPDLEDSLTRIPLFAEIDRVALAQLAAHLDPLVLREGDTVCRQGEPGDRLFVLTTGRLGVHVHDSDGGDSRPGPLGMVLAVALVSFASCWSRT
jgi:CRP/FNR family cyclic AMP-dependent transcriptional regulator